MTKETNKQTTVNQNTNLQKKTQEQISLDILEVKKRGEQFPRLSLAGLRRCLTKKHIVKNLFLTSNKTLLKMFINIRQR